MSRARSAELKGRRSIVCPGSGIVSRFRAFVQLQTGPLSLGTVLRHFKGRADVLCKSTARGVQCLYWSFPNGNIPGISVVFHISYFMLQNPSPIIFVLVVEESKG